MAVKEEEGELAIRVRTIGQLGLAFPPTAQSILDWAYANRPQSKILSLAVPALPPSVNHMYISGRAGQRRLTPEALAFRELVKSALGDRPWRPHGLLLAVCFFSSPHWITKRRLIRKMDVDNRQKALLDAIGNATGVNDCRFWEYHAYKIAAPEVQTSVYVVDLGDIVEWYK